MTRNREPRAMWVIFLEIGLALVLAFLIVWLTLPRKRGRDDDPPPGSSG